MVLNGRNIGIDFKIRTVTIDGKKVKMQLVLSRFEKISKGSVGHCRSREIQNNYYGLLQVKS